MTHAANQPASSTTKTALAPDVEALDERSRRAWTERMAVHSVGDGHYEVESASGMTYIVDLEEGGCTCPDSQIRGALCKHARRVALEITQGRVPYPGSPRRCRVCGSTSALAGGTDTPFLCADCRLEPGDLVYDRERGSTVPMIVIAVTDRRADEVTVDATGRTVAEYPENHGYDPSDPVVEVVYPRSVRADRAPRRYSFPLSRLSKHTDAGTQTTLTASS